MANRQKTSTAPTPLFIPRPSFLVPRNCAFLGEVDFLAGLCRNLTIRQQHKVRVSTSWGCWELAQGMGIY